MKGTVNEERICPICGNAYKEDLCCKIGEEAK